MTKRKIEHASCAPAIAAALLLVAPWVAVAATTPRVLRVGTLNGSVGDYATIQDAVDAAQPGDWILIAPGDYHERGDYTHPGPDGDAGGGVLIRTPNIHLRGMDRNQVIVDGTKPGSAPCDASPAAQDPGPPDAGGDTVSSAPANLQVTHKQCGIPNAGEDLTSDLADQVICATEIFGPCPDVPGHHYPRTTEVQLKPLPAQKSMRKPCNGVPANPWCS